MRGGNFASLGARADLDWLEKELSKEWTVKVEGIFGPPGEPDCVHSICTLNRLLTWTAKGIEWESDPRHVQILLRELNVAESGKSVTTPGVKEKPADADEDDVPPPVDVKRWYRSLCMRIAYLAQDRPDLGIATRELTKGMQVPTERHVGQLKRIARFLKSHPRLIQSFANQERGMELNGWCDADHAGCLRTRKSTTVGLVMIGIHTLIHWCRGQAVIAISSGEAEFYSLVTLIAETCGLRSLAKDWNLNYRLAANVDATAAIGSVSRRGLGKAKHIDTIFLWVQEKVDQLKIVLKKQDTKDMLADMLTKFLSKPEIDKFISGMGFAYREGSHELRLTA